jgi:hypothetical protein
MRSGTEQRVIEVLPGPTLPYAQENVTAAQSAAECQERIRAGRGLSPFWKRFLAALARWSTTPRYFSVC